MKILRILLIGAFLFTVFAGSARAQEVQPETGFIPLLTEYDASVPQQTQILASYQKLLPILHSAQQNGIILEFQPEFTVGAVRITFASGTRPAMLGGAQVFQTLSDAAVVMQRPLSEQQGVGIYNPHFYLELFSSCPLIHHLIPNDYVVGSLRDSAGKIVAVYEDYADSSGRAWTNCFEGNNPMVPGHNVTFKVYRSDGMLRGTYTASIPLIKITGLDSVNSVIRGTGPAGKTYDAYWYHPNLNAANTSYSKVISGTISNTRNWSVDFGAKKVRGGDMAGIFVNYSPRFTFRRFMHAPSSYCYLSLNSCGLYGFANQGASVMIAHVGARYKFRGNFSAESGLFTATLQDSEGYPINLVAGDTISGTGILSYSLPNLTTNVNFTTDVISGKAPANRYFYVIVSDASLTNGYSLWVHSDASGAYSADFSGLWDLDESDTFIATISYQDPIQGNETYFNQPFGP